LTNLAALVNRADILMRQGGLSIFNNLFEISEGRNDILTERGIKHDVSIDVVFIREGGPCTERLKPQIDQMHTKPLLNQHRSQEC